MNKVIYEKKDLDLNFRVEGGMLLSIGNTIYIFATTSFHYTKLISLTDGNLWNDVNWRDRLMKDIISEIDTREAVKYIGFCKIKIEEGTHNE